VRRIVTTLALASLPIGAACGSFGEGGNPVLTPGAADADVAEAALPDEDGGGGVDAAIDGKDAGNCRNIASEDMTVMPADWQSTPSANGMVSIDSNAGVKGAALRAELTKDAASSPGADVSKTFTFGPALPSAVRLSFAVRVVALDPIDNYAEIGCVLQFREDSTRRAQIKLVLSQQAMRVVQTETPTTTGTAFAGPVPVPSQWYFVTMAIQNITPTSATAVASVDGVERLSKEITYLPSANNVRVECGIDYANQATSLVVLVDDVTLDFCD
jgi:hypothetical protein